MGKVPVQPSPQPGTEEFPRLQEHTSETEAVEVSDSVYVPIAGRIKHFYHKWTEITSDVNILKIVRGCKFDFTSSPIQHTVRETKLNKSESDLAKDEIKSLVNKGVLKEVDYDKDQFISTIFFRPKPDGTYRMILNLKGLNNFIEYKHFKMEHLNNAILSVTRGCFMGSIDLRDAYYTVPIHEEYRKFVRFIWEGHVMGVSMPRFWFKLRPPIIHKAHETGIC